MDLQAIKKAYPNASLIDEEKGIFDSSGEKITTEESKVSAARTEIDTEYAALEYSRKRAEQYASLQEQMDMQYWDSVNGTTTWKDHIAKVKSDNPKTS
tara:strand:+ start:1237 stop:1530 length:294 start_codon:yes stop_codon:yes gene_type:complete